MNKQFFPLALASITLALAGCSQGKQKDASAVADSTVVATADSGAADEPAAANEPVIDNTPRADLVTFDLYGAVRQCVNGDVTVTFDENGTLTTYNGKSVKKAFKGIKRDGKGRITKFVTDGTEGFGYEYTYGHDGRVATYVENLYYTGNTTYTYKYNSDGVKTTETSEGGDEVGNWESKVTYTVNATDDHGNWTKRTAKVVTTETEYDGEEEGTPSTKTTTKVETRTITYYK